MNNQTKPLFVLIILSLLFCMVIPLSWAKSESKTLSIGTAKGKVGSTVSVPVFVDNPSGIAGIAFTVSYDSEVLEFKGIESVSKKVSNNEECDPKNDFLYQVNNSTPGKVVIAGATAQPFNEYTLFNMKFNVLKNKPGTYSLHLSQTVVNNPSAGYSQPEAIPVLVGFPADTPNDQGFYPTPVFQTNLLDGSITVEQKVFYITDTVSLNSENVSGLKVRVYDENNNLIGEYPVDENGNFKAGPLIEGQKYITKVAYGALESEAFDYNKPYNWQITLHKIAGNISGLDPNATVTVTATSDKAKLTKSIKITVNQNGTAKYEIRHLIPSDDYIIVAVVKGFPVLYYNGKTDITQADKIDITNSDANHIDFTYTLASTGSVSGKVTNSGNIVTGIGVYAFEINTFALSYVLTDSNGQYQFNLSPGDYQIFVLKENGKVFYYSDSGTTQNESEATIIKVRKGDNISQKDIDITECGLHLHGKVTYDSADGEPVPDVLIIAKGKHSRAMDITKSDGTYELTGLCDQQQYVVKAEPLKGNYGVQEKVITAGKDTVCNFIIPRGYTLSGKIINEQGKGIPAALIVLIDQETKQLVGNTVYLSNKDGKYSIKGISEGVYILKVSHSGYKEYKKESLVINKDTELNITLTKGAHISGKVIDAETGEPIKGAVIIAVCIKSLPLYDRTDKNGQFAIYGVDSNKVYSLIIYKRGYQKAFKTGITPTTGDEPTISEPIKLEKPKQTYTVYGKITSCGQPVLEAEVILASKSARFLASTTTDKNGEYKFEQVIKANDYRLVVIPSELQVYVEKNIAVNEDTEKNIILPCGETNKISGIVKWNGVGPALILLYTQNNEFIGHREVKISGKTYEFRGLDSSKQYKVLAIVPGADPRWYDGKSSIDEADLVNVGSSNIDFDFTAQ